MNRQAHAVTDLASRRLKALKIERLLGLKPGAKPLELLEIGTGSGGIAHYFAAHTALSCNVTAVDVHDNRQVHAGYDYIPVQGVELPFEDARFDLVISNHVIEHVGDESAQLTHLQEICRVLRVGGCAYLAVPNRWMLTEPHYRLKLLSWLPKPWRTPYLRWSGKGDFYDCEPLELGQIEAMLAKVGVSYWNICIEGLRETLEIERPNALVTRLLRRTPDGLLRPFRRLIPTLIYRIKKNGHGQ